MGDWVIEHRLGTAADLHALAIPEPVAPTMWICEPTAPALVLGSAQAHTLDLSGPPGVDLVVRRSGGGAVLLVPGACTWVDFLLPVGHHLWDDDVGRAAHWVGELWARSLRRVGAEATVHAGGMVRNRWSHLVCFAGIGPGEVLDPQGAKLVGVSQRRTRTAARFQTVAYHRDLHEIATILALDASDSADLASFLAASTSVIPHASSDVIAALRAELTLL